MNVYPAFTDTVCDPMLAYAPEMYSGFPSNGASTNFFPSGAPVDAEAMMNSDEQSYDGSETGSVPQGSPVDARDNYGLFSAVPDMDSLNVSRADLELLEAAEEEPQRPHKKKMKAKVSLAHLTEEERLVRRRKKNREAAQLSRHRKMMRLDTLEQQVAHQKSINGTLLHEREVLKREAQALRSEVEYLKMVLSKSLSVANVFGNVDNDLPHEADLGTAETLPSSFLLSVH